MWVTQNGVADRACGPAAARPLDWRGAAWLEHLPAPQPSKVDCEVAFGLYGKARHVLIVIGAKMLQDAAFLTGALLWLWGVPWSGRTTP